MRDAAKELLADNGGAKDLVNQRDRWIQAIRDIAEVSEAKKKYAMPTAQFLSGIGEEQWLSIQKALSEREKVLISWLRLLHQTKG